MPTLDTKGSLGRLYETYKVIKLKNESVSDKFLFWYESAIPAQIELISSKMHLGKSLIPSSTDATSLERKFKRALILLRASLLWENIDIIVRDVNSISASDVEAMLNRCIAKCQNIEKTTLPPSLAYLEAKASYKAMGDTKCMIQDKLEPRKDALKGRTSEIYSPFFTTMQEADHGTQGCISTVWHHLSSAKAVKKQGDALTSLDKGGALYIVGHGNFGHGIGTHNDYLNERDLVRELQNSKLSKTPDEPINIYLFACWTGTYTRRAIGGVGKRSPFAQRLADKLAQAGYNNIKVIGFSGCVYNKDTYLSQLHTGATTKYTKSLGSKGMYCIYEVKDNRYRRTEGVDWITKCTLDPSRRALKFTVSPC